MTFREEMTEGSPAPAGAKPLPVGGQGLTGQARACRSDRGYVARGRPDGASHGFGGLQIARERETH